VTNFAALVFPATTVPKASLVGATVTVAVAAFPVPVRVTLCGLVVALCVTVNVAVLVPDADGLNVTVIEQLAPAARVFGAIGHVPPHA
jgi:hypothetical protein